MPFTQADFLPPHKVRQPSGSGSIKHQQQTNSDEWRFDADVIAALWQCGGWRFFEIELQRVSYLDTLLDHTRLYHNGAELFWLALAGALSFRRTTTTHRRLSSRISISDAEGGPRTPCCPWRSKSHGLCSLSWVRRLASFHFQWLSLRTRWIGNANDGA